MDLGNVIFLGHRRRLIDLRRRPGLQLKLPALLLMITAGFSALFLAHTEEALGAILLELGQQDGWLRNMVEEIQHDYLVVSLSIVVAYASVVVGICLAATHRLLGPIVALRRHLANVKNGDYASRVHLRAGHPLSGVAEDLNELSEILKRPDQSSMRHESATTSLPVSDPTAKPIDRLLMAFDADDSNDETLEPPLAAAAS